MLPSVTVKYHWYTWIGSSEVASFGGTACPRARPKPLACANSSAAKHKNPSHDPLSLTVPTRPAFRWHRTSRGYSCSSMVGV